jgi:hypothetical protein
MTVSDSDGRFVARIGRAESPIEVYDAAKGLLRFELFGSGEVVTPTVVNGRVTSLRMGGVTYDRVEGARRE